ncbi:hypothetical protein PoB_007122200 [Plakobranchus ocellatus]|uniref:Globin family profile domain-containing protein n=1 Tax=Plakobranchus ocellatus TaxID=259542 RepID=A0AAV4DKA8_9GAST|nr:hypothetical protein PoB_007122200 [Plakobranchus ocellatus]
MRSELVKTSFTTSAVVYFNCAKRNPRMNPFAKALEKNPEVYYRFFVVAGAKEYESVMCLNKRKSLDVSKLKEGLEFLESSDRFQKHLKVTNKFLYNVLGVAMSEDISATAISLRRIGAKHAEILLVFWSVTPHKNCLCFAPGRPGRPSGVDVDAMTSLRNMAATVEALMND